MKTLNHWRKLEKDIRKCKDIPCPWSIYEKEHFAKAIYIFNSIPINISTTTSFKGKKKKKELKTKIQEEPEKTPDS